MWLPFLVTLKVRSHFCVASWSKALFSMRFNVCAVKHVNALLRCSLIVTAVALLRTSLRSALLRKSVNEPLSQIVRFKARSPSFA